MKRLSGYTCVRNGIELDYCFEQCILSMLPVCDEVVVCDSDSTDGTHERLMQMEVHYAPKIRVINRPWSNPYRYINWWVEWINWTRQQLSYPMQLMLDADEVLDPGAVPKLHELAKDGRCAYFDRVNFYGGAHQIAAEGHVCGHYVARLGPQCFYMPSDEPHHEGEPEIRKMAIKHSSLRIFHYGFLRKPDAFYRKSKVVMNAFFGREDDRVVKCEKEGVKDWAAAIPVPVEKWNGSHPALMHEWLVERGWLNK